MIEGGRSFRQVASGILGILREKLAWNIVDLARSPTLRLLAATAWVLLAFSYYLPDLFPSQWVDFHLRRSGTYDVLITLWFAAVAYCAGKRFLRLIGVGAAIGAEETLFSVASGLMLFSYGTMVLSLLHGLHRPVAYALLVVPTLLWQAEIRRLPGTLWRALKSNVKRAGWTAAAVGQGFLVAYISVVLALVLISALGPSFEYDDLVYHLTGPKNFILAHRLVPLPDVPLVFFPKNVEMLHTLAMLLHCDIVAKLIVFLCGCTTMVGVYGFSARFLSRPTGLIAVTVLASSPLFIWEMRTAHNDLGLTLFVFSGLYATVIWLRRQEPQWFRLACVLLAFSVGAKYWALLALGITVSLVFVTRWLQSRELRPALVAAFRLGLYSSLGLLPWAVINFYYTGNPLFPLLNDVFRSPYWTSAHTNMALGEMFQGGIRITSSNWWDLFRLPWEMMTDPRGRFGGNVGPWYVIFIPLLVFFRGMGLELGLLFAASALYFTGWAVSGPWVRFVLPALPGLAAGVAFAIASLLRLARSFQRVAAIIGAVFLSVLALLASPYFEDDGSWSRYGNALLYTLPLRYLAGQESRSDYLGRFYSGYRAVEYLNHVAGEKKVLYVHTLPDGFYLNGKAAFHYSPYVPGLVGADADRTHEVLRQHGITHVIVEQPNQDSSHLSSRESDFTHRYLRKLFQRNTSIVYELLPARIDQTVVAYDFLDHLDETSAIRRQPGTSGSAYKAVRRLGEDSRYTIVVTPPAELDYVVRIPSEAVLSFASAREDPNSTVKGSFQVWISSSDTGRRLISRRDLPGEDGAWVENRVSLAEYAGRRVRVTLKAEESSSCCGYYWADPVLLAPSRQDRTGEEGELLRAPQANQLVSGGKAAPAVVNIGQSFEMTFSGTGLSEDMYFDIRYRAPQMSADQVAFNWQHGISSHHTLEASTFAGRWVITGVRAHLDPWQHEGEFNDVAIALDVIR